MPERGRHTEADGNRPQTVGPVELEVLTGVQHVEAAHPRADGQRQHPRLPAAAAARGEPPADRRHRHRQAQKHLGPRGEALGERIPEDERQRDRRERETERAQPPRRVHETGRRDDDKRRRFAARHRAAGQLAVRRSRVQRVDPRVHQPVEPHRRAARRHHGRENPADRDAT